MSIQIKSFNQTLGDMIRKIIAETPVNDVNAGSILLTLLEACAANDFENNVAILNVLELLNVDAIKNSDLDSKAGDYGLKRKSAVKASGQVTIYNSNIVKRSTGLYVIKPAPIAGQTTVYVNNTSGWASTGSIYIGRGTDSFEGPIAYTAIIVYPTYSAITLASALQKDHLISDVVVDSQGEPDRIIAAGTVVKIPANNQNPEIQYITLRDAVIPSGEDKVENVDIVALVAGSQGNASINTITQFDTLPFSGATVLNTSSLSSGKDIETDAELRNRIKSYSLTLARGTAPSILSAVLGVSDQDDSKQVSSAVIAEPVKVGDPSIMYIDDGSGFQPSYAGQSVDKLLASAQGGEEFLQLANYPVPRPQVVNAAEGPFNIADGSFLRVNIDGQEETVYFAASDFLNISSATVAEVIVAINDSATTFKARFTDNSQSILLYPVAHDAEIIQVAAFRDSDNKDLYANSVLKFPTNEFSYISLYQNSDRLREKSISASLETTAFAAWNVTSSGNIIMSVDGTPAQDRTFSLSDFGDAVSFTSLTLEDWVVAFNAKFAGITASSTPSQTIKIVSNKEGAASELVVSGGTLFSKLFANVKTESFGQSAQFELNRQTGNLRILSDINKGDSISAGVEDAKGFVVSSTTSSGSFNLSSDSAGRPAEMVMVADASCEQRSVPLIIGSTITVSDQGSSKMRLMSSTLTAFANVLPGDFIYITVRSSGWLSNGNCGLYKVISKGSHLSAGSDSYVEVLNDTIVAETKTVLDSQDIKAFRTDGYPQVWRGIYLSNPPAATLNDIVASINKDVLGFKASVFKSSAVKVTSATENDGSIALPVVNGLVSTLFSETAKEQTGNPSHLAVRISDKSLLAYFKRTTPVSANVWLDRQTYADRKASLTANATPDAYPFSGTYSETVESTGSLSTSAAGFNDLLLFTKGNNRGQLRSVKALISGDKVGTQQSTARTELDHIAGDELQLVKPLQFSTDDSVVFVLDKDASAKTVDVRMARTGRVNTGSGAGSFSPTTTEFSANDYDNEPNIDFNNVTVWGTSVNGTDFSDYAVWMRARNWYASGGVSSGLGALLLRSAQYGPNGESLRFAFDYPDAANQDAALTFANEPSYSLYTYVFGSGAARPLALINSSTITITGPYPDASTNFPGGASSTGAYFDYAFSSGTFTSVTVGDVITLSEQSGVSSNNRGTFRVAAKSGNSVRLLNYNGSAGVETITDTGAISVYPLADNSVTDIVNKINAGTIMVAVAISSGALTIDKATRDEDYAYAGNATALAYGHNPGSSSLRSYVGLYDGYTYVKSFQNVNPNFTLKTQLVLNGVAPSMYAMGTCPNSDVSDTGELFKLIPTTVKNIHHHLTQKALSQLPIVANVDISDDRKNVQIKSKQLGSEGAIEVVGGQANKAQAYLVTESEVASDVSGDYLLVKVPAFPDTFNAGDVVKIQNDHGVKRLSRLVSTDSIDVTNPSAGIIEYQYNPKVASIGAGTQFAISDVSGTYGKPSGYVWRWTHDGSASLAQVSAGDLLIANGTLSGWDQGNKIGESGDGKVGGFPIVAVNDLSNYIDVVNPHGVAMSSTAIGSGSTVQICPSPIIKWTLTHSARAPIASISRISNVVTVLCTEPHRMNSGDSVSIIDSDNIPDGTYSSITALSATSFSFTASGANFSETSVGASALKSGATVTRYRMERLGYGGLVRLSRSSGDSPTFLDCGVAVDDYIVIGGSTFAANNNGRMRVLAVDNDSILFLNDQATDALSTTRKFNNKGLLASWTSNSNIVTGASGAFKNVQVGDWVKKSEDADSYYRQVVSVTSTQITLGASYTGTTDVAAGIAYDEQNDFDKGVYLAGADDVAFYEGDSAVIGDSLFIQNIVNSNWFSVNNIGSFAVSEIGLDGSSLKPFLRVNNSAGSAEAARQMSVDSSGFYVTESDSNKFYSIREVSRAVIDDVNEERRSIYIAPHSRSYKFGNANSTSIVHMGKLGYNTDVTTGVDGYLYYTGLLRRVQRIVDGFEPDPENFPGRRAVGGSIEILPPLIKKVAITIDVSTDEGVNLGDISNNIKSVIINYVHGLGVGQDVVLSEIIAAVMQIKGVGAVTFSNPTPSTERIVVASNEKVIISPEDIGIA